MFDQLVLKTDLLQLECVLTMDCGGPLLIRGQLEKWTNTALGI